MELISPVTFTSKKEEDNDNLNFSLDMDFFKKNKNIPVYADGVEPAPPVDKKKRGRPKKEQVLGTSGLITDDDGSANNGRADAYIGTTIPYAESFNEANMLTKTVIAQVDEINNLVRTEINNVANSKTLKKKYEYITELAGTSSNLLATKMRAISELNKTTTDAHKLEIQRIKDLKIAAAADAQDDDRRMQEMYNSFISTPINMGGNFAPAMNEISFGTSNFVTGSNEPSEDIGYMNYISNLTPEQNMMRLEASGNVETVLVYDPMTGARQFAVVDKATGAQVPNVPIPSDIILENTHIDSRTGMARNRDINKTYRVVTVGSDNSMLNHI